MSLTLGVHSPVLARVRALRTKKGREEQRAFAIEGPTLLAEALAAGADVREVFGTPAALAAVAQALDAAAIAAYEVPEAALARLSDLTTPPGLIARIGLPSASLEGLFSGGGVLALAGVSDPGNAGTLLRSAEAFGVRHVAFIGNAVEAHAPKVVRAAMGAHFRLTIAHGDGEALVRAARAGSYTICATARKGIPLPEYAFETRSVIVVGHERTGVTREIPAWDDVISVPQISGESLNAAVAGSIVLYAYSIAKKGTLSSLGGAAERCYTSARS